MGVLVLTSVLLIGVMAFLLLVRGGAREPVTEGGPPPRPLGELTLQSVGKRAEELIEALGLRIIRRDPDEGSGPSYLAVKDGQTAGERVYVVAYERPDGERVREPDVAAAIDMAHSEGFNQTLLVSPNGFTDEAILAAEDSTVELIDEAKLEQILAGRTEGAERPN